MIAMQIFHNVDEANNASFGFTDEYHTDILAEYSTASNTTTGEFRLKSDSYLPEKFVRFVSMRNTFYFILKASAVL